MRGVLPKNVPATETQPPSPVAVSSISSAKSPRLLSRDSVTFSPSCSREGGRIDDVHFSAARGPQEAHEHGARDRRGVHIVDLAAEIDVQAVAALRRDLREEEAELFAQREVRPDGGERLRIDARHVHRIADFAVEQRGADLLRDFDADAFLRFRRRCAEMRREDEIRQPAQRRIGGQRLGLEDIERRGGDLPGLQRLDERRFVDQSAARAVHDAHALLRPCASRSALSMYFVSAVSGMCSVMKSACGTMSSSESTSSTWSERARLAERYGS